MTLKIGTILIAKEDFGEFTKGKEYPIVESNNDITYRVICNDEKSVNWFDERRINQHFTIKRYTLQDLKDKKIAVRLKNCDEFKRLCEAIGDDDISESFFDESLDYYGVDEWGDFMWLRERQLEGRILLDSIDEIDLDEWKEEVKETYTCKYCEATLSKDVNEEDCYANPNKNHDSTTATLINSLESEIARLKAELDSRRELPELLIKKSKEVNILKVENEELKKKNDWWEEQYNSVCRDLLKREDLITELQEFKPLPYLEKRERMAWELMMKTVHAFDGEHYLIEPDEVFEMVDLFLAKSKEVKP